MMSQRGFTLLELVVVMVLIGIMAASVAIFLKPSVDGYVDARRRAEMTDAMDGALRLIAKDVRRAIPNSLRVVDGDTSGDGVACAQLVPSVGGGRYRVDVDSATTGTVNSAQFPLITTPSSTSQQVDLLTFQGDRLVTAVVTDDTMVVNNQNGDDVYDGPSRSRVTVSGTAPASDDGIRRVTWYDRNPAGYGYTGGRYMVVSQAETTVTYMCNSGVLYRVVETSNSFTKRASCPAVSDTAIVSRSFGGCTFTYDASGAGATVGVLTMTVTMDSNSEKATLAHRIHVDNTP